MKLNTIRNLYAIGIVLALVVFALMVWDHYQNAQGWLTALLITFIVLVVLLLVMLILRPAASDLANVGRARTSSRVDWLGDVHEVVDLEGVGPTYADRLHAMGIENTQQLIFAETATVAKGTGAQPRTVEQWKAMSQLIKVRGIGPQYAEALVRAGVSGIEELVDEPAAAIAGGAQGYLDSLKTTVVGQKITTKRVEGWQASARKLEKGEIDLSGLKIMPLESKAAKADAKANAA